VRSADGGADTVFSTLFGLSSQKTQVGPKPSDIDPVDGRICNPEKSRQNIVSTVSKLADFSIRADIGSGL
jgi:hypothetical protein